MSLQALYDVKDRLEHAAIAGTGLLGEDFRLTRATDALAPLAAKNPVFAKIHAGLQKLVSAPADARNGLLLDTLALVDAVVYTQGATGMAGDLQPLPVGSGVYCEVSYGLLHPLLEALTTTGGGRMEKIETAWKIHPEYFSDYRVLPLLVRGLGDSYGGIADLLVNILQEMGNVALPVLKSRFDPVGKREMQRVVEAIDGIAGADENDFYLEYIPKAKMPIRKALIYALRHDPNNTEKLIELAQTERGEAQKQALLALSFSPLPAAEAFWNAHAEKKPALAAECMLKSTTEIASNLVARLLEEQLAIFEAEPNAPMTKETWEILNNLRFGLPSKSGEAICNMYRHAARLGTSLRGPVKPGIKEKLLFWCSSRHTQGTFDHALSSALQVAIKLDPTQERCALADALCRQYGGLWAVPAMCAALLTMDSMSAYDYCETILNALKGKEKENAVKTLFTDIWWNADENCYGYFTLDGYGYSPLYQFTDSPRHSLSRPLAAPLDMRWYDLLISNPEFMSCLSNLIPADNAALCEKLGKYFYYRAIHHSAPFQRYTPTDTEYLFRLLLKCGWTDWKDFLPKCVENCKEMGYYAVYSILQEMPIPDQEKADQLQKLDKLAYEPKINARNWVRTAVERQLANWWA